MHFSVMWPVLKCRPFFKNKTLIKTIWHQNIFFFFRTLFFYRPRPTFARVFSLPPFFQTPINFSSVFFSFFISIFSLFTFFFLHFLCFDICACCRPKTQICPPSTSTQWSTPSAPSAQQNRDGRKRRMMTAAGRLVCHLFFIFHLFYVRICLSLVYAVCFFQLYCAIPFLQTPAMSVLCVA